MKWYRGPSGDQRLWLDRGDIELMMEDELRMAGLLPAAATPAVDIEGFLERYLKVGLDQHADLAPDVLGLTEFFPGKPPHVAINRPRHAGRWSCRWHAEWPLILNSDSRAMRHRCAKKTPAWSLLSPRGMRPGTGPNVLIRKAGGVIPREDLREAAGPLILLWEQEVLGSNPNAPTTLRTTDFSGAP